MKVLLCYIIVYLQMSDQSIPLTKISIITFKCAGDVKGLYDVVCLFIWDYLKFNVGYIVRIIIITIYVKPLSVL